MTVVSIDELRTNRMEHVYEQRYLHLLTRSIIPRMTPQDKRAFYAALENNETDKCLEIIEPYHRRYWIELNN